MIAPASPSDQAAPSDMSLPTGLRDQAAAAYARALGHLRQVQQPKGALAGEVVWNPMLVVPVRDPVRDPRRPIAPSAQATGSAAASSCRSAPTAAGACTPTAPRGCSTPPSPTSPCACSAHRRRPARRRRPALDPQHGGVVPIPTWGRVWLAMLGLYPWSGVQPILPEMWLLPEAAPVHPRRLYNHMRLIYLGLSYVYGARLHRPRRRASLRSAASSTPRATSASRFAEHRDEIAATDLYEAPGAGLRAAFAGMRALEPPDPRPAAPPRPRPRRSSTSCSSSTAPTTCA
jgi:hypothetical protein